MAKRGDVPAKVTAPTTNVEAVRAVLDGRGDDVSALDGALGALAMTLAAQLDAGAGMATAAVSKELRAVLETLVGKGGPSNGFALIFGADLPA